MVGELCYNIFGYDREPKHVRLFQNWIWNKNHLTAAIWILRNL